MGNFFAEFRRRHLYRIGAGYVVVAWALTQVVDVVAQIFAPPVWIPQAIVVALSIGFPAALAVAWMIEGKAHEAVAAAVRSKATAVDWVLAGGLAIVLSVIGYQQLGPVRTATTETRNAASAIAGQIVDQVTNRLPRSIAVLPFENLSPDPEDAYFAAGIHEEILSKLSRLQNLNVIARNSVMPYAGGTAAIHEIAAQLSVEKVMRGSVRYAGDRVRVTAQLIDGMTDLPVWTYEEDGSLTDVFGFQAEIAMNIANSLRAEYSTDEQKAIEAPPTDSPQAYALFLRAKALVQTGLAGAGNAAVSKRQTIQSFLDEALKLDPEFALAHAWKALVYTRSWRFDPVKDAAAWLAARAEYERLIREHATMALAIDPNLGLAHAQLADLHWKNLRARELKAEADEALRLDPNDPDVLWLFAWTEVIRDRPDEGLRYMQRSIALDPNTAQRYENLASVLRATGMHEDAVEALDKCLALDPADNGCVRERAAALHAIGNDEAALAGLKSLGIRQGAGGLTVAAFAAPGFRLLGQPEDARIAFNRVMEISAGSYVDPGVWAWAYMGIGDYEEALNRLKAAAENPQLVQVDFMPLYLSLNLWADPKLEERAFADAIDRLLPR